MVVAEHPFGHDHPVDPLWLGVFILLQAGRLWVIASLGQRWTTRVIVLPSASSVARGPYRWLRHPNYVGACADAASAANASLDTRRTATGRRQPS
jgi:methyltransferase